jgi:YesN/AraC family two-component response regulator
MNTLFRKAAEKGGVHPIYLNTISSDFAKRIENINSLSVTQSFMLEIMRTYCQLVRRHSVKNLSPLIKKIIIKIESDLSENLSLKELAKENNVSANYLSGLFKKENGVTLTEYVNSKRIEHAKHLLKNTNLQIQTIAQHCGIFDLHYFCRIFKKMTGKTPSSYRSSLPFN